MRASILLAPLLAAATLATVKPAEASTTYPQVVSDALGMPCVPSCLICHTTLNGGLDTVTTAFGKKAISLGQTGGAQDALLKTTLTKMGQMGINSDADPEPDIEELKLGLDPSVVGGDVCGGPKYGCGASIAAAPIKRSSDPTAAVAAVLTALAGVLMMRRGRR